MHRLAVLRYSLLLILIPVLLFPYPIKNQAYATPNIPFEPLDHSYNLNIDNKNYTIQYGFSEDRGVKLVSMTADINAKTITVKIDDTNPDHAADNSENDWEKRLFIIELPRNIIDANTQKMAGGCSAAYSPGSPPSWVQEHDIDYGIAISSLSNDNTAAPFTGHLRGELCGQYSRTFSISYPYGKTSIVIQGTAMIPEFGLMALLTMTAAIVGVIGASLTSGHILRRNSKDSHAI